MPTAAIYARGLNAPYTEGHLAMTTSLVRAIQLGGWSTVVLNFRYATEREQGATDGQFAVLPGPTFQAMIPALDRDRIIYNSSSAVTWLASALESSALGRLMVREVLSRASLVHLVNCFMIPRALIHLIRKTPVIAHVYQTPTWFTRSYHPHLVDGYVASTMKIANRLRTFHADRSRIFTVSPAVDTQLFGSEPVDPQGPKIGLYIGNLTQNRVPDEMFSVLKEIIRSDPDTSFRLIGPVNFINNEMRRRIDAICERLAIQDRVRVSLQNMSDQEKSKEFAAAKFFIFAPKRESDEAIEPPLTILEAMACGIPVVATNTYSASEAVTSKENGFLVNSEEYGRLAERALEVLGASPDRWRLMSAQSRKTALDKFSVQALAERLITVHSAISEINNS